MSPIHLSQAEQSNVPRVKTPKRTGAMSMSKTILTYIVRSQVSRCQPVIYARDYARDPRRYLSAPTPILLQLLELRLVYEPVDSLTRSLICPSIPNIHSVHLYT